jgi:beta-galactosidase/beta-glucuronidase
MTASLYVRVVALCALVRCAYAAVRARGRARVAVLVAAGGRNELVVHAFDPSDSGAQPNGKQRISAISSPGGDTYTPSSGIWQTVWLESVPASYVTNLVIDQASTSQVTVTAHVVASAAARGTHHRSSHDGAGAASADKHVAVVVVYEVLDKDGTTVIATASGAAGEAVAIPIPAAHVRLWSPEAPNLYDLRVTAVAGGWRASEMDGWMDGWMAGWMVDE